MTAETVDDIWEDDLLNRREDAQLLFDFLVRRQAERVTAGERGAYVVNLAAPWGEGKSFFLERLGRQMRAAGHVVAEVNAWRDDMTKEPMVAVMASIERALKPHLKTPSVGKAWKAAKTQGAPILGAVVKGAAKRGLQKFTGDAIEEIQEIVESDVADDVIRHGAESAAKEVDTLLTAFVDKQIKEYSQRIKSAEEFQNRMRIVLERLMDKKTVHGPMFVLVDELDRCRPTYAIEMLEQIKHLFDIDNVVFLLSTDGEQLEHSIAAVYGEKFDSRRYLHRFFHRRFEFAKVETRVFIRYLFVSNNLAKDKLAMPFEIDEVEFIANVLVDLKVSLREAHRCFDILKTIITMWEFEIPLQLTILMPMIVLYQRGDKADYESFYNANRINSYSGGHVRLRFVDYNGNPDIREVSYAEIAFAGLAASRKTLESASEQAFSQDPIDRYWGQVFKDEWTTLWKRGLGQKGADRNSVIRNYRNIVERMGAFDDLMAFDRKDLRDKAGRARV